MSRGARSSVRKGSRFRAEGAASRASGRFHEDDEERQEQFEGAGRTLLETGTISALPDFERFYARDYWDL